MLIIMIAALVALVAVGVYLWKAARPQRAAIPRRTRTFRRPPGPWDTGESERRAAR
jgi:hypothetical protein